MCTLTLEASTEHIKTWKASIIVTSNAESAFSIFKYGSDSGARLKWVPVGKVAQDYEWWNYVGMTPRNQTSAEFAPLGDNSWASKEPRSQLVPGCEHFKLQYHGAQR